MKNILTAVAIVMACISMGAIGLASKGGIVSGLLSRMKYRRESSPKRIAEIQNMQLHRELEEILMEKKLERLRGLNEEHPSLSKIEGIQRRRRQDMNPDTKEIISNLFRPQPQKSTNKKTTDWYFGMPGSWQPPRKKGE